MKKKTTESVWKRYAESSDGKTLTTYFRLDARTIPVRHSTKPWTAEIFNKDTDLMYSEICDLDDRVVCEVISLKETQAADVALLVTAPKLLAALVALTSNKVCSGMAALIRDLDHRNKLDDSFSLALDAIAEAKGFTCLRKQVEAKPVRKKPRKPSATKRGSKGSRARQG